MNLSLPIIAKKEEIVTAVKENRTVVITAETGAGKSTQIPQYLYEAGFNVVCTQPRRIACVNLAMRVREEIKSENGNPNIVGYQTALEIDKFPETKILYCTDGLKLAQGIHDSDDTILIIDEVHEWNLNIEMLIAWVKKHREQGGKIRVVIMSATMDVKPLLDFYKDVTHIHVEGRNFKIKKHLDAKGRVIRKIRDLVKREKNILVFRSGRKEIENIIESISNDLENFHLSAVILPLYSDLCIDEQQKCFVSYNIPKIVVATNIAQTSVTIPDIDVVIDDGMEKYLCVNYGVETLMLHEISQADIEQRAGRAGRVRDGSYYLFSDFPFEKRERWPEPDIQRLFLDQVVLRLAAIGFDVEKMDFFHQPDKEMIKVAKNTLCLLGALNENGITELGRKLAAYPVSVRPALMIEKAREEGIVNEILKAVAVIEGGFLGNAAVYKESRSDILRQVLFFEYICNFMEKKLVDAGKNFKEIKNSANTKFSDFIPANVNEKAFIRAYEYMQRLSEFSVPEVTTDRSTKEFYIKFLKCLCRAYPEQIFFKNVFERDWDESDTWIPEIVYVNEIYDFYYKKARDSIVDNSKFVLAFPKHISFVGYHGWQQLAIVEKISTIQKEILESVIDPLYIKEDELICFIDEETGIIVSGKSRKYLSGFFFPCEICNIYPEDPNYQKYFAWIQKNKKEMDKNNNKIFEYTKFVIKNNNEYVDLVYNEAGHNFSVIFQNFENIIDIPSMLMPTGNKLLFNCKKIYAEDSETLRYRFKKAMEETKNFKEPERIPITSLEEYFKNKYGIGEKYLVYMDAPTKRYFVGLVKEGKQCTTYKFISSKKFHQGMNRAILFLVDKWFKEHKYYSFFEYPLKEKIIHAVIDMENFEHAELLLKLILKLLKAGRININIQKYKKYPKEKIQEILG